GLCVITTNKQRARNHLEKKNYVFIIKTANKTMVGTMKNLTNFNPLAKINYREYIKPRWIRG
ncbi:unnamed protein product, partial [Callosobruchus maculatus]